MRRILALALPLVMLAGVGTHASATSAGVSGIDTAKYQHDNGAAIDWNAVKRSGKTFAFIKATGHADAVDPWFTRDWAAAGKAGLIRGAYHYADPSKSAVAQADAVVKVVGTTREANDLGIVLDLETTGGLSPTMLAAWTHTFLDRVETHTGRVPILYTYVSFWSDRMANNRSFGAYPLWLARYGPEPKPLAGWNRWTFWQTSSSAHVPGIAGLTDSDVMCCSAGTLAALADGRSGPITALWHKLGGASGTLGLPLGPEAALTGGWGQSFEHGYIASSSHGVHAVLAPLYAAFTPTLGVPTGDAATTAGVTTQSFTNGTLVYSRATGAQAVLGATLHRWLQDGGVKSAEGLPMAARKGAGQQFQRGNLYVTSNGVHLVAGAIRDHYVQMGGAASTLGLPTADSTALPTGAMQQFQGGVLVETDLAGQSIVV